MNVLGLLPVVGQPRFAKRIAMMREQGAEVRCLAFERPYHKGRPPDCALEVLGRIPHGRYLFRLRVFLRSIGVIRRRIKDTDVVYAFGLDMLLLGWLASLFLNKPLVLEIGDIRAVQTAGGLKGRLFRVLDKWLVRRADLVVFTAEDFYRRYYQGWLGLRLNHRIIENKIDFPVTPTAPKPLADGDTLVIGYFGVLRCEWSVHALAALADAYPDRLRIKVAGFSLLPAALLEDLDRRANVTVQGPYCSPRDLPALYGEVDMIWASYAPIAADDWNLRWARTNRFYEACAFGRPLVTRQGSNDGKWVAEYDIGLTLDAVEPDQVVTRFKEVSPAVLRRWQENMRALPSPVFACTDEASSLHEAMRELVSQGRDHRP